jgi:hypothetical protein
MVQTKIWQMTLFQNLILFTNHYGNLQQMLEMASFLRYVDLYLTSEWDRFYVGHPVLSLSLVWILQNINWEWTVVSWVVTACGWAPISFRCSVVKST